MSTLVDNRNGIVGPASPLTCIQEVRSSIESLRAQLRSINPALTAQLTAGSCTLHSTLALLEEFFNEPQDDVR